MRKINFKKIGLAVAMLLSAFTFQSLKEFLSKTKDK